MNRNEMAKVQRELMCLTQKRLAEMSGINAAYISRYENGTLADEEVEKKIHAALTSLRDKLYPEKTYERQIYTFTLHCQLFTCSETFYDKVEYLNKIMRDVTFLLQYVMNDKKKNDAMKNSYAWRR